MDNAKIASSLRQIGGKGSEMPMPEMPPKVDTKQEMAQELMEMGNRMVEMAKEMMGGDLEEGIDDTGPDEGYE